MNTRIHAEPILAARGIVNRFGAQVVHDKLDLDVMPGEIIGIAGGSGFSRGRRVKAFDQRRHGSSIQRKVRLASPAVTAIETSRVAPPTAMAHSDSAGPGRPWLTLRTRTMSTKSCQM